MKRWSLLVGLVSLAAGVIWFGWRAREPSYGGRTRSEWLESLTSQPHLMHQRVVIGEGSGQLPPDAVEAIRAMGTNQVSYYLSEIERDESLFDHLKFLAAKIPFLDVDSPDIALTRKRAGLALFCLGDEAAFVHPQLRAILTNGIPSETTAAVHALASRPEENANHVLAALAQSNEWNQVIAIWLLAQAGTNAIPHVSALAPALARKSEGTQSIALWALSEIELDSEFALSAFTNAITKMDARNSVMLPTVIGKLESSPLPLAARTRILVSVQPNISSNTQARIERILQRITERGVHHDPSSR